MNSIFRLDGCAANRLLNLNRSQENKQINKVNSGLLPSTSLSSSTSDRLASRQALILFKRQFSESSIKYTEDSLFNSDESVCLQQPIHTINQTPVSIVESAVGSPPEPVFNWFDQQGHLSSEQSLYLLKNLHRQLEGSVEATNTKLAIPLVSLQLLIERISSSSNTHLAQTEVESLYQLLEEVSLVLPKGELHELTQLLSVQVRLQGLLTTRETIKSQLYQQLKKFEQPGASSQIRLSLQLSAGAGLLGVNFIDSKLSFRLGFQLLTDDDSGILEIRSGGIELGIQVGSNMLKGVATGSKEVGTVYSDGCLTDFVNRYTDHLMEALLVTGVSKNSRHMEGWKQERIFQKIQQQALTNQHRLNNLLLKHGFASEVKTHTAPAKLVPGKCKLVQGKLHAGLKLFQRIFQGSYQKSQLNMDIMSRQPLLDSLKQESSRIYRYNQQTYTPSINRLAELRQQSVHTSSLPDLTKQVVEELEAEFLHYSQLVQFCDYAKQHPKQINKQQLSQAKQIKASFEAGRGVKGRGEFTKAVTIAYAALHQLYMTNVADEQQNKNLAYFSQFEATLKRPLFHLAEKSFINKLTFAVRSILKRTYEGGSLQVSLPTENAAIGLHITHFNTKEHPNYYRKGQYLDITIELKGQLGLSELLTMIASERAAFSSLKDILQLNDNQAELSTAAITGQLKEVLSNVGDIGLDGKTSLHFRLKQIKLVNKWVLQFVRLATHSGLTIKSPDVNLPILPSINSSIGASVKACQTTIQKEWLGNNTLSYLLPIHNTLQGANQSDRWKQFTHQHEHALKKLFSNMAKEHSVVNSEMTVLFAQINDQDLQAELKLALSHYTRNKTAVNFQKLVSVFNQFLAAQYLVYQVESQKETTDI
ncbi:hypothetical protein H0A36_20345 [Endozoicomonas sp. SM1973]|uniref:Uncharacterized protein n=1 Tax=Spartinivicinus marinus TaxID=2994442 RepID=A0A853I9E1_9GAMM|nr:hypothetical protein [Spartinivicinus marinus]MCX4028173.1 hypothetical protein [Spartinivicinus marinus]NYZ68372.1 hypothetical protein [Spartinivicinus marinus]